MTWAQKRKFWYIFCIVVFLLIVLGIPAFFYLYNPPTCFDGKQNQDELGVDCGGVCTLLCPVQYAPLNILWSRFSRVTDGSYNVLAYVQNPNISAMANNLDYVFRLYDKKGALLSERFGKTSILPNKTVAVFEPNLQLGNNIPLRAEFSFISPAIWVKQESVDLGLAVAETIVSRLESAPRISFTLTNKTTKEVKKIEAIAIIYNAEGNTVSFSRTIVDSILGNVSKTVNFNWPKPFEDTYARTEIILKLLK